MQDDVIDPEEFCVKMADELAAPVILHEMTIAGLKVSE